MKTHSSVHAPPYRPDMDLQLPLLYSLDRAEHREGDRDVIVAAFLTSSSSSNPLLCPFFN